MKGTHNSLTGYPVEYLLLRPFTVFARCQDKTLEEQHAAGARCFDLRFARIGCKWLAAHGAMIFRAELEDVLNVLNRLSSVDDPVYFRAVCEDTFYRKSDVEELAKAAEGWLAKTPNTLKPLYVSSKRTWKLARRYPVMDVCGDYSLCINAPFTPKGMAAAVRKMYELETATNRLNFIACYSSTFIPRLTANILAKTALEKQWKGNDVPIVDFI
jgi:hypothetical protein